MCPYYQPSNPPPGSGPFGSPPLPAPLQNVTLPGLPDPERVADADDVEVRLATRRVEPRLGPSGDQRRRQHHVDDLGGQQVKAFTERNPKVLGLVGVVIMAAAVLAILLLNRSVFSSGYTINAQFPNAAGISHGTNVMVAGVNVGTVKSVTVHGDAVDAQLSVNNGVQLPHVTTAAVEVETLLGVVDVTLKPVSGWDQPLKPGAMITDTSVPTEFYQLQNTAHSLLSKTNAKALNNLVTSLANITQDKQQQVAQIISGLGALTTTVDQRSGQVSQLIDSANTLSSTLAGRDQQLLSVVNNLNTVSTGLAAHDEDLSNLISNVDSMATQTNSLVSQDAPALNSLLGSLHADLNVVGQHQEDLAEGVSYLGSALEGLPVDRLQRLEPGAVGQHLREPGLADPGPRASSAPAARSTRC